MPADISKQTIRRLPNYLNYLKGLGEDCPEYISATSIAEGLKLNHVQVRKDIASISTSGRPKVGYLTKELINELERFLGRDLSNNAVLVGAGKLGRALIGYDGFRKYGLNILAAFDKQPNSEEKSSITILPAEEIKDFCKSRNVKMGIITVPAEFAQEVCDQLVDAGILAIWNFAPVHLTVPDGIIVQNENMASSLAVLSKHLAENIKIDKGEK